jgi:hypothetical protein
MALEHLGFSKATRQKVTHVIFCLYPMVWLSTPAVIRKHGEITENSIA